LSGLQNSCLTAGSLKRLEVCANRKMCALLKGKAREHSNLWVRSTLGIAPCSSVLHVMRLRSLRSILQHRSELGPLIAVLFGTLADGMQPQLDSFHIYKKSNLGFACFGMMLLHWQITLLLCSLFSLEVFIHCVNQSNSIEPISMFDPTPV
jgi:hypothetical protein